VPEADPVLHVIAGPNGAGKTTLYEQVIGPTTHLEFINADVIAAERWPAAPAEHAYDAAEIAARLQARRIAERRSFVTETVFSHESKLELLEAARQAGFRTTLHVVLVPEDLAVARVESRVSHGGHDVPEDKVRGRFGRLWAHLRDAVAIVNEAHVYDNSRAATPFRQIASFVDGVLSGEPDWPKWTPQELRDAGN
jgi:predicted ABC-type ATPase